MGYIHKLNKDRVMRENYNKNELCYRIIKYNLANNDLDIKYRYYFYWKFLKKFKLTSSSVRIVNRCIYTSRAYWTLRFFKLSRMTFKTYADYGKINGIRRATW